MAIIIRKPAGDIDLSRGLIGGQEYIAQRVGNRLKFFLGEWFLDQRLGVPYFREILRKGAPSDVVRSVIRQVILETPGILSVERCDVTPGAAPREIRVDWEATATTGQVTDETLLIV